MKSKLELTWIGKENRPRLEPRILLQDLEKSYHAAQRMTDNDIFDNRLIYGDNLLALKALEQEFAGKIKCIFIDPPYNTGSAFTHYDDGIEHSIWLSLIRDRLELIQKLLSNDGSLWITIDDAEGHYLKVMCDEIFGRINFLGTITWQKTTSVHNNAIFFSSATDMVLAYAKNLSIFKMGRVPRNIRNTRDYKNPDNDVRGPWTSSPLHVSLTSGQRGKQFAQTGKSSGLFAIINPNGNEIWPPKGRCWGYSHENIKRFEQEGLLWWGKKGANQPRLKRFLSDNKEGVVPITLWLSNEVGHNQEAKVENSSLLPDQQELFSTPKPERLLQRVLILASNPGDIVLDSFAGSGTTGAVAHKMGRRWIMVELGEHCHTHIIPRLKKVIDGTDQGGISKAVNWKGGGGFRYYRLAPSLLDRDKRGNWVISGQYNAAMLASAMAKHEGFVYNPDESFYWKQGKSTEKDYIFTTTNFITVEYLDGIHEEMQPDESLLICCKSFQKACADRYENITVRKIPNMLLGRCEFGRDDYSLNVASLPWQEPQETQIELPLKGYNKPKKSRGPSLKKQQGLFEKEGD